MEEIMSENKEVMQVTQKKSWEEALEKEAWLAPLADIYETQDDFFLVSQMPGVNKEDVKIKLEDGHLILMGRIDYDSASDRRYVLKETETGNFYRRFKISESIDEQKIDANMENGILKIRLPKHERVKPKTIAIK
jgi:HSP20 family molecular chaperone IbpA